MKKLQMLFAVAADSPETMSANAFERFLGECQSAGVDLAKAKEYVLSFENLNPYTRSRVDSIYADFTEE